jgi:hypothetical protein
MTVGEETHKTVLLLINIRAAPAEGKTGTWINMSEPYLLSLMAFPYLDATRSGFF